MKIKQIVIHCSESPDGRDDRAEDIHAWHKQRGWDGIGYHYVVIRSGEIEPGRPPYWEGAHVQGHNEDTLGICLIGTRDFDTAQMVALMQLLRSLKLKHPNAQILGHYQLDNKKTCPNFDVPRYLKDIGLCNASSTPCSV